jgi:hypothetical protein
MTAAALKVTRINTGVYDVRANDQGFELERFPDGSWLLFETRQGKSREYLNDFATKRCALAALARSFA